MKRIIVLFLVILLLSVGLTGCRQKESAEETLTIYSYDSFVSYGLPDATNKLFEEKYNCKIEYRTFGGVGATLNRLILEKNNPQADLFVGLNMNNLARALEEEIFISYRPENYEVIPEEYRIDKNWRVTPFDGPNSLAIIYDSEVIKNPPRSFEDLLKPEYKGKLILEDPRSSSPGMGFLLWTIAVYGEDHYLDYWEKLEPTIFHIYPDWTSAFDTAFVQNKEAPMVLSYDVDPAYFYYEDEVTRYKAVIPEEGGWLQLEFVGIVNDSKHQELAQQYMEFMLSREFQENLPLYQWAFPIDTSIQLPECYDYAVNADKYITLPLEDIANKSQIWLEQWIEMIIGD